MSSISLPAEFTLHRKNSYNRATTLKWIASHARPYWWIVIMIIIGAIGNAALAAYVPVLTGDAFNSMIESPPDTSVLLPLALIIGISQIVRGVLQLGRNFGAELMAQRMERDIRDELYLSLLGKSMTFHNLQPVGDTMARATNDVREVNFMFNPGVNLVVGSFMFIIMLFFAAPRYHPSLLITPTIFTIIYFIGLARYLKSLAPITDEVRATFGDMNTHLSESLDGVEIMKGAAQEGAEVDRFVSNARKVRDAFVRQGDLEGRYIAMLLLGTAYAGGLVHALLLFRAGTIDLGAVVAYFGLLRLLEFPTFTSTWAYSQISSGLSSARRILELINRETHLDQNAAGRATEMRGEVEFRGVSFAYPEGDAVIQDVSFKIKQGQTVAIVGQTGAGKTSLARLINRTYDVTAGQVLIDGVDVREWNLAALRSQISIIEQDIFLFSRSLSDNIAFGKPGATKEEIISASIASQAHDFILDFDQTYGTVVGERGVTLSGGQRQRIALARAFLTDPRILVLDDSTSAIDSATEDKIQRAIANAARGRTTFIITHRLSQIRWADLIIVLRKGKIAAIGSHDELMKTSEAYSRIFRE
ncbi:MAG TPA: ABC transporter ATP-binding protein [Anaerolineales bacterium]|nr:ABC transporter ATP-binding protein [Anaerolineales bacterium]HMX21220.1 ABC transporter ATP-binding protein [Anaerolineales bacterium]HMX76336.1 ABC transporter ATP-binding protein [Anaerolineales bacterium]HMZ45054.1 ABC transporter ATP-binding protein [Anaerolineales bacterium]HNA56396.1 ABC transporter ATP-binding protein [Anaerolineales bacterium]